MNKIKTGDIQSNVRMAFTKNGLDFLQGIYKEGFVGVMSALLNTPTNKPTILSGCEVTITNPGLNQTFTISEGYVYWQNEIFYSPLQIIALPIGNVVWGQVVESDTPVINPVEFDNGTLKYVYKYRRMNYYVSSTSGGGAAIDRLSNFYNTKKFRVTFFDENIISMPPSGGHSSLLTIFTNVTSTASNYIVTTKNYGTKYNVIFKANVFTIITTSFSEANLYLLVNGVKVDTTIIRGAQIDTQYVLTQL
jgi:hypothetical protein